MRKSEHSSKNDDYPPSSKKKKKYITLHTSDTPNNFCAVPYYARLFFKYKYIFKGSVLEHSSAFCDVEADFDFCLCLLILLFLLWASSFLVVDCETTRMFFILVRSHPQHLFPIWQILEQRFLGEKMMVAWWFKNKLFTKILHLSLNQPTPPLLWGSLSFTSFTSSPLSYVGLSPNKVTSSWIVGEIVKFSLSPCGSNLAVISSNCDCNTETGWNRLASYFSSGSLWAYLNI